MRYAKRLILGFVSLMAAVAVTLPAFSGEVIAEIRYETPAGENHLNTRPHPCHIKGRLSIFATESIIKPTGKVAALFLREKNNVLSELIYQEGSQVAIEYDLFFDAKTKKNCLSSDYRVISITSFRQLYGATDFDRFTGQPI